MSLPFVYTACVVNVKVKNIRPDYENLEQWMNDPNNVYIGRRGVVFINGTRFPAQDSVWCNPFKIGKDGDRDQVLELYENYIKDKLIGNFELVDDLLNLNNKNLGCWCSPEPCHGDILIKLINIFN